MKMEQLKPLKGLDDPRTINQEVEIMLREGDDIDYQIVDYWSMSIFYYYCFVNSHVNMIKMHIHSQ